MNSLILRANPGERQLSVVGFQQLAAVPTAVEWVANSDDPSPRLIEGPHPAPLVG